MPDPLTIAEFQQHIRVRYFATDEARGTPRTWMWFIEEVGELARALAREAGEQNIAEEFADVFAWLCTLANINGVDLEAAVRRKYLSGGGPEGTK
jgi:NTP pyrophosphatase (non-canonical NTP hydrolase)